MSKMSKAERWAQENKQMKGEMSRIKKRLGGGNPFFALDPVGANLPRRAGVIETNDKGQYSLSVWWNKMNPAQALAFGRWILEWFGDG